MITALVEHHDDDGLGEEFMQGTGGHEGRIFFSSHFGLDPTASVVLFSDSADTRHGDGLRCSRSRYLSHGQDIGTPCSLSRLLHMQKGRPMLTLMGQDILRTYTYVLVSAVVLASRCILLLEPTHHMQGTTYLPELSRGTKVRDTDRMSLRRYILPE
jgi:hypothetical protein